MPADRGWLARLLAAFELADDVGAGLRALPAPPGASPMVRRELAMVGPSRPLGRDEPPASTTAPFFTDANGCVARRAWEEVPFREVAYAEDRMLARDMLSAGWAKAYHPAAAVVHSHDYPLRKLLRRSFDEGRGMLEVNGFRGHPLTTWPLVVQRAVRDDAAMGRAEGAGRPRASGPHRSRTTAPARSAARSAGAPTASPPGRAGSSRWRATAASTPRPSR